MGKGKRTRTGRADKQQRRQLRTDRPAPHFGLPGGWHVIDPASTFTDIDFDAPDPTLLDTSACPVADTCAGCGATTHLHAVTSAFTKPGGYDIGCATLCHTCDGRSFLHLLNTTALTEAFARHASHQSPTTNDQHERA